MTYNISKFIKLNTVDQPTAQTISTTYTEISGSKCLVESNNNSSKIMYKFNFSFSPRYQSSSDYDKMLLHVKLQKSNDNFSSNIVDISGCEFNISSDTVESDDKLYGVCTPFFIIEGFDSNYLRLVTRSYSSSNRGILHRAYSYDGGSNEVYFNTSLIVAEL